MYVSSAALFFPFTIFNSTNKYQVLKERKFFTEIQDYERFFFIFTMSRDTYINDNSGRNFKECRKIIYSKKI